MAVNQSLPAQPLTGIATSSVPDTTATNAGQTSPQDAEKAIPHDDEQDELLVRFTEPYDAANPKDWHSSRKWAVTGVLGVTGFTRIMVSTMMAPALSIIAAELQMNSVEANMALSVYLLATAFGPLLIGPLSEVWGRAPILHISSIWFLIWNLVCGFAHSKGLLISARLLAGLGASAIYALAGGVLGDMYRPEERGRSLGIYLAIPLLAVACGPIIGGYLTQRASWRWMFWSTSIAQAVMVFASWFTFRETYAPVILEQRAKRLRKSTGRYHYTAAAREHGGRSILKIVQRSLSRPIRLLLFHPIIQINGLLSAFEYGVLYIILATFSTVWTDVYHLSIATSGLHYFACALGELAGAQVGAHVMDWGYIKLKARYNRGHVPEYRIPLTFPFAFLAPLGMFLYGWSIHYKLHWALVDLGVFILTFGMQIVGGQLQAYVMDAYEDHVSSALAAEQFLRSLTAFAFPLFAPSVYAALGYGWANSMLGFVFLGIGVPAPVVLWLWGARLRAKAGSTY